MNIQCVAIPAGIQTDFLKKTSSGIMPDTVVDNGVIHYPAFVTEAEDGSYEWFDVPILFKGQDMENEARFRRQCYAELRKFFYGSWEVQAEQQFKGTFNIHQRAVRLAFPSADGPNIRTFTPYEAISAMKVAGMYEWARNLFETNPDVQIYWSSIQQIDLDNADFISFCHDLGVTDEQIQMLVSIVLGEDSNEQPA